MQAARSTVSYSFFQIISIEKYQTPLKSTKLSEAKQNQKYVLTGHIIITVPMVIK